MKKSPMYRAGCFLLFLVEVTICASCVYVLASVEGCQSPIAVGGTINILSILVMVFVALFFGIEALRCFWAAVSDSKERE